MNEPLQPQRATASDAESILALQKRAYESEARLYDDWSIPPMVQTLESLIEELSTITVLKAVEGPAIIGSVRARMEGATCAIGRLIVDPAHQGRGVGTMLLETIERSFPNAAHYELFTGSRSERNVRLYQRQGYSVSRTEQRSETLTVVLMRKPAPVPGR